MPNQKPEPLDVLNDPLVWSTLIGRMSGFSAHDVLVIADFCDTFQISPAKVIAKMRANIFPSTETVH